MRKLLLALGGLLLVSGLAAAVEVTLVSFDKDQKEVTVKEGEAQKVYRITDATKFYGVDPEGKSREMTYDDAVKGLGNDKSQGRLKFDAAVKDDELVEELRKVFVHLEGDDLRLFRLVLLVLRHDAPRGDTRSYVILLCHPRARNAR